MNGDFIYLDYNATTPIDPRVAEQMQPYLLGGFGNPSSGHKAGRDARRAVEEARAFVATSIGARPEEIIFTSGGSESNNLAISGLVKAKGGGHVITSSVEHPAVLEVVRALEREGKIRLTVIGVDEQCQTDLVALERALAPDTILVTVMLANNEVGAIQPIRTISDLCRARGVVLHTDAAQALAKIPVNVDDLGVDLLTIAGHKLYAPKGVGALYVRRGIELVPLIRGAAHERGLRAGTENVLEAVGLGAACELVTTSLSEEAPRLAELRDRLQSRLVEGWPSARIHAESDRLPNTLSIALTGVDADVMLARLTDEVGASAGAACHAEDVSVSHVLEAMGVDASTALSTLRLTVGRFSTDAQIDRAAGRIVALAEELGGRGPSIPVGDRAEVALTRYTHGLGCACKLESGILGDVLNQLPAVTDPRVLVGAKTSDDACAVELDDGTVLVQTLDFFTPIVDDPKMFGAIAAANALSDVYAMGADPMFALNILAFPIASLPRSVLAEIIAGAIEVADEAGIPILGGHSIEDNEPKFGWVVTGRTTKDRLWKNEGARPGDKLLLTKSLGFGIWSTANKHGSVDPAQWQKVVAQMRRLNRSAAETLHRFTIHAATDVTGFGLLGHLQEMLASSKVGARLFADDVPIVEGTERLVARQEVPGGTKSNLSRAQAYARFDSDVVESVRTILADAQTSGGLLVSIDATQAEAALDALRASGNTAACIGEVVEAEGIAVRGGSAR